MKITEYEMGTRLSKSDMIGWLECEGVEFSSPRMIKPNTLQYRKKTPQGEWVITRLFDTDIVAVQKEGRKLVLNSGTARTVLTKNRINDIIKEFGLCVFQRNKEWFVSGGRLYRDEMPFTDEMVLCNV